MNIYQKGQTVIFALLVLVVLVILGTSIVYLVSNESRKINYSKASTVSFYIAQSGVSKAIWELGQDSTYSGETETSVENGVFTVSVSTTAIDGQYQIISHGYTPNSASPKKITNIRVICKKPLDTFSPVSAFACNSDINLLGNARIDGRPDIYGIAVPAGATVTIGSAAVKVYGTPTAQGMTSAFTFEDVFHITLEEYQQVAQTSYTDPANNSIATGLTFIDFISDSIFQVTDSGWSGDGILVVDGDFKMTGGSFTGILYITGDFELAGNPYIDGAIYVEGNASLSSGTPRITYDQAAIETAKDLFTYIKVLSWEEF